MSDSATEKYLQAVRMLTRAHSLDSEHPDLHWRVVHLRNTGKIDCNFTLLSDMSPSFLITRANSRTGRTSTC
jgi:hypothetical protein